MSFAQFLKVMEDVLTIYSVFSAVFVAHALGMPLQRQDRALRMGDGFYYAVIGHLDHLETGSYLIYGLVMGTVGRETGTI